MANMTTQEILQGIKDWAAPKVIYDISAAHNNTKYADLSDALGTNGGNIPQEYRKGGITVRYVQSSDNKYVQYFCKSQSFSTDPEDWAIADDGVYVENPEYVYVKTDAEGKILWAIKIDGGIYYGAGCPQQVKDYIEEKLAGFSPDEYEDIVTFLNNLEKGDKTLQTLLNEKVDKVEGKSLIDEDVANGIHYEENPEFLEVTTDSEDKVLEGIQQDGTKVIGGDLNVGGFAKILGNMEISGVSYKVVENPEYLAAWVDAENKVVFGFKNDGKTYVGDADFLNDIKNNQEAIDEIKTYIIAIENPEFAEVHTDADDKVLYGVKQDGDFYFGAGIPSQIQGELDNKVDKEEGKSLIDAEYASSQSTIENPEFMMVETDHENRVLGGRKSNGNRFENMPIEIPAATVGSISDIEGRHEIITDSDDRIISYRKEDGTKVENVGFESPKITTDSLNLSESGMTKFQQDLKDSGFNLSVVKIKDYNLPKFGYTNIVSETFYLTTDERYSDKNGIYLIRDYEDTNANAAAHITLDYFYIKSTLTNNGDGTYSKNANSVKLDFYPASKVAKVSDKFYVLASLGEGGTVLPTSIEVTQLTDTPHINAWPVNKKDEHYCTVTIDFGHYLSGTFKMGVKFQGSSTLNYRKKNFRFTFYKNAAKPYYPYDDDKFGKKEKVKIGEFVRLSGFNLKANWTDSTRVKEALMYRLIEAVWDVVGASESYPWAKDHTAYTGATGIIKGFPIECNVGGEYYGYNFFSLKKDGKNYLLDKDEDGMFECGTRGNVDDLTNWTTAKPADWEDELNDEEDWVIENQTQSNYEALTTFFAFINERLYNGSDSNIYDSIQLTEVDGTMYVTSTLEGGVPVASSVSATLIPFNKETMPERMSIEHWLKYIVCMQVFLMRDNTCRNLILYTGSDKKKFYPFFYDLDLSWSSNATYNQDIMIPAGQPGSASYAADMSLWENFKNEWWDEIINCYHVLRDKVLNIPYMKAVLNSITEGVPNEVLEKERIKWGTAVNSFEDNLLIMESRLKWLDEEYYK